MNAYRIFIAAALALLLAACGEAPAPDASADAAADTELLTQIPAARLGEASEVASLVDYLCSPQAGFITGADIAINGGQHIY